MSNFITALNCSINMKTNRMKYAIAGHYPPIVYRSSTGDFIRLEARGRLLGFIRGIEVEEKEMQLLAGDRLVLYTDGITDALNQAEELYGEKQLLDVVRQYKTLTAEQVQEGILRAVQHFVGLVQQFDDMALVIVKRESQLSDN